MSKRPVSQLNTADFVTPTPVAKHPRLISSEHDRGQNDKRTIGARRTLFGIPDCSPPATQEPSYVEGTTEGLPDTSVVCYGSLKDVHDQSCTFDITKETVRIGRLSSMDLQIGEDTIGVSRVHCKLILHSDEYCEDNATLIAFEKCWVCYPHLKDTKWELVPPGTTYTLFSGSHFRLVQPGSDRLARLPRQEFQLQIHAPPPTQEARNPGTHSFDCQYLDLLRTILDEGEEQQNKKGSNITLQSPFQLKIDLSDNDGRYLVPMTSLRSMSGKSAILEALWYLRGEDHVRFLQQERCRWWDKQCDENGLLGWNYGLLTNFPQPDGKRGCNQLEENVLKPLCKLGSQSRNMVCTLVKPDEETVQISCTSGIQFSVRKTDNKEILNLEVTQRSSDTILGLPNDVTVWSIILQMVCREVYIRTNGDRNLVAGTLYFHINAGGAHIYSMNIDNAEEILKRQPMKECQPRLDILGFESNGDKALSSRVGMFQLAEDYGTITKLQKDYPGIVQVQGKLLEVKGYDHKHPAITIEQAV